MAGGRHRTPASDITLKGDLVLEFPSSITTATRQREVTPTSDSNLARTRRSAPPHEEPSVDVWVESRESYAPLRPLSSGGSTSSTDSGYVAFATEAPPSPPPKDESAGVSPFSSTSTLPSKGGFYSKSTSIAQARSHKSLKQLQGQPELRAPVERPLNWRDKGQEMARLRKKGASRAGVDVSLRQVVGVVASLAILSLGAVVYVNSRGKSAVVKHMQRREQTLAASLTPTSSSLVSLEVRSPP